MSKTFWAIKNKDNDSWYDGYREFYDVRFNSSIRNCTNPFLLRAVATWVCE